MRSSRQRAALLLIPAIAAIVVYLGTLSAEFVYDDRSQILENPWVKELGHLPKALTSPVWAFKYTTPTNYYRPVQMGLYNLLWVSSGGQPWAFHALNVILHGLNALLLALLVSRLSRRPSVGLTAALLFAVHPLNTEAVAWIACLPELTYGAFSLSALLLHVSAWSAPARRRRWLYAASVLSFAIAVLSKETAVTMVGLVVLLEWLVRPAEERGPSPRPWTDWPAIRRAVVAAIPHLIVTLLYVAMRVRVIGGVAPLSRSGTTPLDALISGPTLLLSYVGKILVPRDLLAYHVFDPVPSWSHPAFLFGAVGVLLLLAGLVAAARIRPELAIAGGLFLFPLLPVLYVPAVGRNAFAERYAYVPTMGLIWLAAYVLIRAMQRLLGEPRARQVTVTLVVLLTVVLGSMTYARSRVWHDNERLARHLIEGEPRADVGHVMLGDRYVEEDRLDEAIATYERGLEHASASTQLRVKSIGVRLDVGRIDIDEAIRELESIPEGPDASAQLLAGLAFAYLRAERLDDAERALNRVILRLPVADGALLGLAVVAAKRGQDELAVDYARRAVEIDPRSSSAYQQMAVSLLRLGRVDSATQALETAIAIRPDDAGAWARLGVAYVRGGRVADGKSALERALEIDPSHARARQNLALLQQRAGS